jgi:hypothetical protein
MSNIEGILAAEAAEAAMTAPTRDSTRVESTPVATSKLGMIYADIEEVTSDLPISQLRPNPVLEVGRVNVFEDTYPRWSSRSVDDLEELPDEEIPIESAIDLTNGEIVVTRFSYYEQRKQDAIARNIDINDAQEGDLNTQAEIDIAIPRAVFGYVADGESLEQVMTMVPAEGRRYIKELPDGRFFTPHPIYTNPRLSRMRARSLVAYAKTRFNVPRELVEQFKDQLETAGFEFVPERENRMGEMRRRGIFNIQAPLIGNPSAVQQRLRQQQDTGFRLKSCTLVAPRDTESRYRDATGATRPEFEGFAWHLADNIRWADVLTADGAEGLQAFSLTTAITGIDHRSADDTRPMGNALRATIQSVAYESKIPDELILKTLGLPAGMPVTREVRALAATNPALRPEVTEINFFGAASNAAFES